MEKKLKKVLKNQKGLVLKESLSLLNNESLLEKKNNL